MNVEKYSRLPDSMKPEEVAALFEEVLGECEQSSPVAGLEIANALDELSDRQWHTYERLDEGLRRRVESWIAANWDKTSLAFTQAITSIIPKLGLSGSVPLLERALEEPLPDAVRQEIVSALDEYGQHVDDPYAGIR